MLFSWKSIIIITVTIIMIMIIIIITINSKKEWTLQDYKLRLVSAFG